MINIFGFIATISSLAFNLVGAGSQFIFHYKNKQVKLTALFVILSLLTHLSWLAYGISIHSPYMIVTQSVGGTLSIAIFLQKFFIYRKTPD